MLGGFLILLIFYLVTQEELPDPGGFQTMLETVKEEIVSKSISSDDVRFMYEDLGNQAPINRPSHPQHNPMQNVANTSGYEFLPGIPVNRRLPTAQRSSPAPMISAPMISAVFTEPNNQTVAVTHPVPPHLPPPHSSSNVQNVVDVATGFPPMPKPLAKQTIIPDNHQADDSTVDVVYAEYGTNAIIECPNTYGYRQWSTDHIGVDETLRGYVFSYSTWIYQVCGPDKVLRFDRSGFEIWLKNPDYCGYTTIIPHLHIEKAFSFRGTIYALSRGSVYTLCLENILSQNWKWKLYCETVLDIAFDFNCFSLWIQFANGTAELIDEKGDAQRVNYSIAYRRRFGMETTIDININTHELDYHGDLYSGVYDASVTTNGILILDHPGKIGYYDRNPIFCLDC